MKQISISGVTRTELGKKAAKAARRNEEVPCVLYGEQKDENGKPVAIPFSVKYNELSKLIFTPHIYLVDLTIDGVDHKAVLREMVKSGADYVVLDQLGFSSTALYLYPAIQKNPELFYPVVHLTLPDTYLLQFDRKKAAEMLGMKDGQ